MARIEKVWEHQRIDSETGRTVNEYTVFYGNATRWYIPEGQLPMTVLRYILSDKVHAEVTQRATWNGAKRTEYTMQ